LAWTRAGGAGVDAPRRHAPPTRAARRLGREVERARRAWLVQHEREPTTAELAGAVGVPEPELRSRLQELDLADTLSLNSVLAAGDETIELGDTLASDSVELNPEAALLAADRRKALRDAVDLLSAREREVLRLLHVEHRKAVEIGPLLGVTESRISQILSAIRVKLADHLAAYELAGSQLVA
jgi:RNA polymerase sigma factor for flagellar operon FliA